MHWQTDELRKRSVFHPSFDGPMWPRGATVLYKHTSQKDKKRLHQFGIKDACVFMEACTRELDGRKICPSPCGQHAKKFVSKETHPEKDKSTLAESEK